MENLSNLLSQRREKAESLAAEGVALYGNSFKHPQPIADLLPLGKPLAAGIPAGAATLFFRPHDVELLDGCGGCIACTVVNSRRVAETRRVELEVGGDRQRVEIELPIDHAAANKSRIAFRPRKWKLFPRAE